MSVRRATIPANTVGRAASARRASPAARSFSCSARRANAATAAASAASGSRVPPRVRHRIVGPAGEHGLCQLGDRRGRGAVHGDRERAEQVEHAVRPAVAVEAAPRRRAQVGLHGVQGPPGTWRVRVERPLRVAGGVDQRVQPAVLHGGELVPLDEPGDGERAQRVQLPVPGATLLPAHREHRLRDELIEVSDDVQQPLPALPGHRMGLLGGERSGEDAEPVEEPRGRGRVAARATS